MPGDFIGSLQGLLPAPPDYPSALSLLVPHPQHARDAHSWRVCDCVGCEINPPYFHPPPGVGGNILKGGVFRDPPENDTTGPIEPFYCCYGILGVDYVLKNE